MSVVRFPGLSSFVDEGGCVLRWWLESVFCRWRNAESTNQPIHVIYNHLYILKLRDFIELGSLEMDV